MARFIQVNEEGGAIRMVNIDQIAQVVYQPGPHPRLDVCTVDDPKKIAHEVTGELLKAALLAVDIYLPKLEEAPRPRRGSGRVQPPRERNTGRR